jgi:hypothetical protein
MQVRPEEEEDSADQFIKSRNDNETWERERLRAIHSSSFRGETEVPVNVDGQEEETLPKNLLELFKKGARIASRLPSNTNEQVNEVLNDC